MRSSCRRGGTLLLLLTFAKSLGAQPGGETTLDIPGATSDTEAPEASPTGRLEVAIVVVGEGLTVSTLESSLGPELSANFHLSFEKAARFGPQDLFRARLGGDADIFVWADSTTPGVLRLYFANRDGTRYLVRTIEVTDQFDEMDREAMAQALEWSVTALAKGTAGLSREEAEDRFWAEEEPVESPHAVSPPPTRSTLHRRTARPKIAVFHGVSVGGEELPVIHGPGARLGVDWVGADFSPGLALSGQYQHPRRHSNGQLALRVESLALRLEARLLQGSPRRSVWGVTLGGGLDVVWCAPETLDHDRFEAASRRTMALPVVSAGLLWQWRLNPTTGLEVGLGGDVDWFHVSYDIESEAGASPFVAQWPVHPTLRLGLEFH